MSQIYNDNTKRPKSKENQLGILGISYREFMDFAGNLAYGLGPKRESIAATMYPSLRIYPKSCYIFSLKVPTTLLSGSRGKGAVGA